MATAKKVPVKEYTVELSLTQEEAEQLKRLIGKHTSGNILTDLYRSLGDIGVENSSQPFRITPAGLVTYI